MEKLTDIQDFITCISTLEILETGKIRLHEKWQWPSGDKSKGESIIDEM